MKLSDLSSSDPHAAEAADASLFTTLIEEMLNDGSYNWADDTLTGIYETVLGSGKVTPGQRRAVENIRQKGRMKD